MLGSAQPRSAERAASERLSVSRSGARSARVGAGAVRRGSWRSVGLGESARKTLAKILKLKGICSLHSKPRASIATENRHTHRIAATPLDRDISAGAPHTSSGPTSRSPVSLGAMALWCSLPADEGWLCLTVKYGLRWGGDVGPPRNRAVLRRGDRAVSAAKGTGHRGQSSSRSRCPMHLRHPPHAPRPP